MRDTVTRTESPEVVPIVYGRVRNHPRSFRLSTDVYGFWRGSSDCLRTHSGESVQTPSGPLLTIYLENKCCVCVHDGSTLFTVSKVYGYKDNINNLTVNSPDIQAHIHVVINLSILLWFVLKLILHTKNLLIWTRQGYVQRVWFIYYIKTWTNVSRTETPESVPIDAEHVVYQKHDTHALYTMCVFFKSSTIPYFWLFAWQNLCLMRCNEKNTLTSETFPRWQNTTWSGLHLYSAVW